MKVTEEPRPARLVAITLPALVGHNMRGGRIQTADPQAFVGWTISLRGGAVFLVSPRGWTREHQSVPHVWNKDGPRQIFSVPRAECREEWAADDMKAIDQVMQRHDTPVMCRPGVVDPPPIPVRDPKELGDA